MNFTKIQTNQTQFFVLAGDLSGFSLTYDMGNKLLVDEFIKRFYFLINSFVSIADGTLVKFTGDGFMAIWPIDSSNIKETYLTASKIKEISFELSSLISFTKLDLNIETKLTLRQGITVEHNGIEVIFQNNQDEIVQKDFLGNMINYAFRIQSTATLFPYIAYHKHFVDLLQDKQSSSYREINLSEEKLKEIFKGASFKKSEIFFVNGFEEDYIDSIHEKIKKFEKQELILDPKKSNIIKTQYEIENPNKKAEISEEDDDFSPLMKKLIEFKKNGPEWVSYLYKLKWLFMEIAINDAYETDEYLKSLGKKLYDRHFGKKDDA